MSELCASVAFAQTERIDELVERRIKVGNLFNDLISDFDDILIPQKHLKDIKTHTGLGLQN